MIEFAACDETTRPRAIDAADKETGGNWTEVVIRPFDNVMAPDGACPECGRAIDHSTRVAKLYRRDPGYLRRVARGDDDRAVLVLHRLPTSDPARTSR